MSLISVAVPSFIAEKTATVEGTIHLKQILSAAFTTFFQSGVFEALASEEKDSAIRFQVEINELLDLLFVEQVYLKAMQAGTIRSDGRTLN